MNERVQHHVTCIQIKGCRSQLFHSDEFVMMIIKTSHCRFRLECPGQAIHSIFTTIYGKRIVCIHSSPPIMAPVDGLMNAPGLRTTQGRKREFNFHKMIDTLCKIEVQP